MFDAVDQSMKSLSLLDQQDIRLRVDLSRMTTSGFISIHVPIKFAYLSFAVMNSWVPFMKGNE